MATREIYENHPEEFLAWYYHRFVVYRHHTPNAVHHWLSDKRLITQNIDGLDKKAGHHGYIPIHGQLDSVTLYHSQQQAVDVQIMPAPWDDVDESHLVPSLLEIFRISQRTKSPELDVSLKPFVLLFDEYYTDLYRTEEALQQTRLASRLVFMGTSFSVGFPQMALEIAMTTGAAVDVIDPSPVLLTGIDVSYHKMSASEYVAQRVHSGDMS